MTDSTIKQGYESPALNIRTLAWILLALAAMVTICLATPALWQNARNDSARLHPTDARPDLPQPLQPSLGHPVLPWEDMAVLREKQESLLRDGSNDPQHRRLPIDQAMDQLLNSGTLKQPWTQPATQPWQRPRDESTPTVENRT